MLTLPEAEDALVLARKFDDKFLIARFGKLVASLKSSTTRRQRP